MDTEKIRSIVYPLAESHGVEITDLNISYSRAGTLLRVFVDKKLTNPVPVPYAGSCVDLNLLENLSREISSALEVYQERGEKFYLEVSSPGLDRLISKNNEYRFFIGHNIKVLLKYGIQGRKNFTGTLKGVDELNGTPVAISIDTCGESFHIQVNDIKMARLEPQFKKEQNLKKGKKKCRAK